jgi:hypothetical protein
VGNFLVESGYGLNPRAANGIGNFGIAQWGSTPSEGERWQNLETWATANHLPIYSLSTQINFVWHELSTDQSGSLNALKAYRSPRQINDAADAVARHYEGAVNPDGSLQAPTQREYEARLVQYSFR